jgi:predicted porin
MRGLYAAATSAAVILLGGGGGAYAADLNTKTTPPTAAPGPATCTSILDFFTTACQLAAYGVRLYGTIDVGVSYQTNGAPLNGFAGSGLTYTPQKMNNGAKWLLARAAMTPSNVGFQITEPLGAGWSFVGQVETQFDPATFDLLNGPHALQSARGQPLGTAPGVSDSSMQGLLYDALGFAGLSTDTWGTLTFGRQSAPFRDVLLSYDPAAGSFAFGLIGGVGTLPGGGTTEATRGTTSLRYRLNSANYHLGLFAQVGGYDEGNPSKGSYQADLGVDFDVGPGVLSVDAAGGYSKDAISEAITVGSNTNSGNFAVLASGLGNPQATISGVTATISDNAYFEAVAKYTLDKLKLYAGYERIQLANPSDGLVTALTDTAEYAFNNTGSASSNPFFINNTAYARDKILQLAFVGARYSLTPSVDVYAGYYYLNQNDYSGGATVSSGGTKGQTCASNGLAQATCSGTQQAFTATVDWQFASKWDTYIGTTYNQLAGGLEAGYLHSDFWATTAGVRFRW